MTSINIDFTNPMTDFASHGEKFNKNIQCVLYRKVGIILDVMHSLD